MQKDCREETAEEFLRSVGGIIRGMSAIFRKEMERYEVTWPQFYLMKAVSRDGGMTVTEVSNRMMFSAPTASRMIDSLCAKGLLKKVKDPGDQRVTRVLLTPGSEELVATITTMQDRIMMEIFSEEDDDDLERTVRHLVRISDRWLRAGEEKMKRSSGE